MTETFLTFVFVEETVGIARRDEPVRVGIPFPRGVVFSPSSLVLRLPRGKPLPIQIQPLLRWRDDSIKWALLEFWVTVEQYGRSVYEVHKVDGRVEDEQDNPIRIFQASDVLGVNTGLAEFSINPRLFKPFDQVVVQGVEVLERGQGSLLLIDETGISYIPRIRNIEVEIAGPLRTVLRVVGTFQASGRRPFADFSARLQFYAWKSLVELELTVRNPRAARHSGGLWDLGDEGSIYIHDLSLQMALCSSQNVKATWVKTPTDQATSSSASHLEIYQDSSGGPNWRSTNHVNRFGVVTTSFPGYRVTIDGALVENGERCLPCVSLGDENRSVSGAITEFWQNFPKAIETAGSVLRMRIFPSQYADVHELQGGEQKRHSLFLSFDVPAADSNQLAWVHSRLVPRSSPEWYTNTKAVGYLLPRAHEAATPEIALMNELVDSAVRGADTFFTRREIPDEYGWRHFGDLYADHEAIGHLGGTPLIAHYNNQYDVAYGAAIQYLRSGDPEWFRLMSELARHVIDIDIYHTQEDRAAYNGGMFWHTAHYADAGMATHRTYSKTQIQAGQSQTCGGGPSSSHNYATGLLLYYLLTGDAAAAEAVKELADWVVAMDDGAKSRFGFLDRRPTGLASMSVSRDYHGPGRGAANSLSTLVSACELTDKHIYRMKAEELIQRCIHPRDEIKTLGLDDVEHRWSYTMFLQSLGKYLDHKAEREEFDYLYSYARESLLHYARWMCTNEVPYRHVLHKVEIPTETWPAQDIRKSNVFNLAAKYAAAIERPEFLQKAEEFFAACITDLHSFPTARLTRPLVLLLTNGFIQPYFHMYPNEAGPCPDHGYDFKQSLKFRPQLGEVYQLRTRLETLLSVLRDAIRRLSEIKQKKQNSERGMNRA